MASTNMVRLRRGGAALLALSAGLALSGCQLPENMHITEGVAPQNVDTDVRFRTTYYFRVFDYCWSRDSAVWQGSSGTKVTPADAPKETVPYRQVIPQTDTLYRYRMTGKSSALFNQIKFESGSLPKAVIDDFGADVVFDRNINGYVVRSRDDATKLSNQAREQQDAARRRSDALREVEALSRLAAKLAKPDKGDTEGTRIYNDLRQSILDTQKTLVTGVGRTLTADESQKMLDQLKGDLDAAVKRLGATKDEVKALAEQVAKLEERLAKATVEDAVCPPNTVRSKGFQLMGPEGMTEFDQNRRLVMAMSTSAKPLIETLQEYSGRVLKPKPNTAEQLLPLSQETLRVVEAQRAVERVPVTGIDATKASDAMAEVFAAAQDAFKVR